MGKKFTQLTHEDRVAIAHLLRAGISKDNIAKQLGYHRSSIFREVLEIRQNMAIFHS